MATLLQNIFRAGQAAVRPVMLFARDHKTAIICAVALGVLVANTKLICENQNEIWEISFSPTKLTTRVSIDFKDGKLALQQIKDGFNSGFSQCTVTIGNWLAWTYKAIAQNI